MRTRFGIKVHALLERFFPERRLFLKSDTDTRFIRLRSETQLIAFAAGTCVLGWAIVATAILLMDSIGAGNFREQAKRDQLTYQERLNELAVQRDQRAAEALAAQKRFNAALAQISVMQSQLLDSETRRHELETGIDVVQNTLRDAMTEREAARLALSQLQEETGDLTTPEQAAEQLAAPVHLLTDALAETARERDQIIADAQDAIDRAEQMTLEIDLMKEENDHIFRQLEDAMAVSVSPLDDMFRKAGLSPDRLLRQVKRNYSGEGGPLLPIAFSTRGQEPSADVLRANRLLSQMDTLNLYRIAAERAPFANPLRNSYRFTSGFGFRRHPITGLRTMHKGVDFAAPTGTPLYATAEGVVTFAGWSGAYGRLIKIKHDFGIETRYAHLSKLRVKVGQKVSRGDRIGDMGNSGRSTGPHLHYEIRVNGEAVNPMIYIKAAQDVF